jgi:ABC-type Zn uptake system ZnuABC Zn-binding protein ZnuA
MKRIITPAILLAILGAITAQAKINIVASLADFGSIAEQIGGDKVRVTALARGTEDPHFADARPSHVVTLNKADLLLEGGAELEIGWLPPLVNGARNDKILTSGLGRVVMSEGIRLLEVPTTPVDRSMGDVHPLGNPHYWLDPENARVMAGHVTDVLCNLDSKDSGFFQANLKTFDARLEQHLAAWEKLLAPYRGTKIITYHKSFEYFAERFGLEVFGQLEPKPGVEPSPTHINSLVPRAKEAGVKLIIIEPYRPRKTAERLSKLIGAPLLILPEKVGGNPQAKDIFSLLDYDIGQIVAALKNK